MHPNYLPLLILHMHSCPKPHSVSGYDKMEAQRNVVEEAGKGKEMQGLAYKTGHGCILEWPIKTGNGCWDGL